MNNPFPTSRTLIETVLLLLLLLALMFALYDVLKVFFGVLTFAIIFSVSFAKLFERFVKTLKGRRRLAGFIYSLLLIAIIAIPFIYIIHVLSQHVKEAGHWIANARDNGVPPLPDWITALPYVGQEISDFWQKLQADPKETIGVYEPQLKMVLHRIVTGGAGMLGAVLEFVAGVIVSAVFLVNGKKMKRPIYGVLKHLLGDRNGVALIDATAKAVKGVAIGVIGTAFIAAVISWIGFMIAHTPFAVGLAALIFFLVLIQVGPLLVWIPLVIWLVAQGQTGWAIFIGIYGVVLLVIDSVLKPILIAKSGKLPFLVLFLGVIGGMVAWGFTGMFKGAIILAVFYTVFTSWLEGKNQQDEFQVPGS